MKSVTSFKSIYIYSDYVDMRKAINGLSTIVENDLEMSLFKSSLFVFCSKSRRNLKMIYWDATGFALWNKKLEKNRFKWLSDSDDKTTIVNSTLLKLLLEGGDIRKHKKVNYKRTC